MSGDLLSLDDAADEIDKEEKQKQEQAEESKSTAPTKKPALYEHFFDLNEPVGIIWPTFCECHGVIPIGSTPMTGNFSLSGKTLEARYYPIGPTKLAESLLISVQEASSASPMWTAVEEVGRKEKKAFFIFPDTALDRSVSVHLEIRQKSSKLTGYFGDKAIASAHFPIAQHWEKLLSDPNGITLERELANPKVDASMETINAVSRTIEKSRVTIKLRYEKLREVLTPQQQIDLVPSGMVRHKVFTSPHYYKPGTNGARDHTLNLHVCRQASELWLNAVQDKIKVLSIQTVSANDNTVNTHDSVVIWYRKL